MLKIMAANFTNAAKRKSTDSNVSAGAAKKFAGHWSMGLKASMEDPELRVDADDKIVIIKDKYPKARFHFLVLPRENIANMKALKSEHVPLLKHMHKKGEEIAAKSSREIKFRFGYHGIPSMSHIHLHVISQDFDSPSLKTKKHWNSFTTEYFIDSEEIIRQLETEGKVVVNNSELTELLKQPLKCHVCKKDLKNIPALKDHLKSHISKLK